MKIKRHVRYKNISKRVFDSKVGFIRVHAINLIKWAMVIWEDKMFFRKWGSFFILTHNDLIWNPCGLGF